MPYETAATTWVVANIDERFDTIDWVSIGTRVVENHATVVVQLVRRSSCVHEVMPAHWLQ
jgi:hypothetical protein